MGAHAKPAAPIAWLQSALGYSGLSMRVRAALRTDLLGYPPLMVVQGLTAGSFVAVLATKSMGADDVQRALLVAAPMGALLGALFFSAGRHATSRQLVFWPALGLVLLAASVGLVSNPWVLLAVLLGIHLLWGSVMVNRAHIWRQNYPPAQRGRAVARILTAGVLAAAASGFVASTCFDYSAQRFDFHQAYRFAYPAAAAVGALGLISLYRIRMRRQRRDLAAQRERRFSLPDVLHVLAEDAVFRNYTLCQIAQGFGNMMCTVIEVQLLTKVLKASYLEAALVILILPTIAQLTFVCFWARLNDRVHALRMRAFTALAWVGCRLVFLLALFLQSLPILYVMAAMRGATIGGSELSWNLAVGYLAPRKDVSRYMSLHVFFTGARGLVAPLLGAYLYNKVMGPYAAVVAVAILGIGAAGFLWLGAVHGHHGPRDGIAIRPKKA